MIGWIKIGMIGWIKIGMIGIMGIMGIIYYPAH
jgi:hypothetical protein